MLTQQCYSEEATKENVDFFFFPSFSRGNVLTWLNESLLPRLLDDTVLLRDAGSVLLGTLRLRQTFDPQGEIVFTYTQTDDSIY